jgi:hypothetical protein
VSPEARGFSGWLHRYLLDLSLEASDFPKRVRDDVIERVVQGLDLDVDEVAVWLLLAGLHHYIKHKTLQSPS